MRKFSNEKIVVTDYLSHLVHLQDFVPKDFQNETPAVADWLLSRSFVPKQLKINYLEDKLSRYFIGMQIHKNAISGEGFDYNVHKYMAELYCGVKFVDRNGIRKKVDQKINFPLPESYTFLGLSFSECVHDIYFGKVSLDQVECIISLIAFDKLDPEIIFQDHRIYFEHILYGKHLSESETDAEFEKIKDIIKQIIERGLIFQPRIKDPKIVKNLTRTEEWLLVTKIAEDQPEQ